MLESCVEELQHFGPHIHQSPLFYRLPSGTAGLEAIDKIFWMCESRKGLCTLE